MPATATAPKKKTAKAAATFDDLALDRQPTDLPLNAEFFAWITSDERDEIVAASREVERHNSTIDALQRATLDLVGNDSLTLAELREQGAAIRDKWVDLQAERIGLLWLIHGIASKLAGRAREHVRDCSDGYSATLKAIREEFAAQGVDADSMVFDSHSNPVAAERKLQTRIEGEPMALAAAGRVNRAKLLAEKINAKVSVLPTKQYATVELPAFDGPQRHVAAVAGLHGELPPAWSMPPWPVDDPQERSSVRIVERMVDHLGYTSTALLPEHWATLKQLAAVCNAAGLSATSPRPLLHLDRQQRERARPILDALPATTEFRQIHMLWEERDAAKR